MTPREFFNAWQGYSVRESERMEVLRNQIFSAARFNASSTAMSKDASRSISKYRFPWEKKRHAKGNNNSVGIFMQMLKARAEKNEVN